MCKWFFLHSLKNFCQQSCCSLLGFNQPKTPAWVKEMTKPSNFWYHSFSRHSFRLLHIFFCSEEVCVVVFFFLVCKATADLLTEMHVCFHAFADDYSCSWKGEKPEKLVNFYFFYVPQNKFVYLCMGLRHNLSLTYLTNITICRALFLNSRWISGLPEGRDVFSKLCHSYLHL